MIVAGWAIINEHHTMSIANEFDTIKQRLRHLALYEKAEYITECGWYKGVGIQEKDLRYLSGPPDIARVRRLIATQRNEGAFPGITYDSQRDADAQFWTVSPQTHLCWLLMMAEAWRRDDSPLKDDPELRTSILRGLDYWFHRDFQHKSWWFLMIGVPRWMAKILLLMESELSVKQMQGGLRVLARADARTPWGMDLAGTAQNQLWTADVMLVLGCLEQSRDRVRRAVDKMLHEIAVRPSWGEGIQADWSFQQHDNTLYSGGYGYYFAVDAPRLAWVLEGTAYAIPSETVRVIRDYLLEHQQWIVRGATYDYLTLGRLVVRPGQDAGVLHTGCRAMLKLGSLDARDHALLEGFLARLTAGPGDRPAQLSGNRCFWRSDYMTHVRPGFFASVKMFSNRLCNTDYPSNSEGAQNHHMSDGAMCLMRGGYEYDRIFGVWDWRKVPGTTVLQRRQRLRIDTVLRKRGTRAFAGGVSDGRDGLAAFDFLRDGDDLTCRKAWFFLEDQVICLGAGITCPRKWPVHTSVNQCLLRGPVLAGNHARRRTVESGDHVLDAPTWVHHDGIGYAFLEPATVQLHNAPQAGNWRRINGQLSPKRVEMDVFSLGIDHGTRPCDEHYAYVILPDLSPERTAAFVAAPPVRVVSNSTTVQAVQHGSLGLAQAAFYQAGAVEMLPELIIGVDRPCAVQLREAGSGVQLAVASPEHAVGDIRIRLSRRFVGPECRWVETESVTEIRVAWPDGSAAGKSVVLTLSNG